MVRGWQMRRRGDAHLRECVRLDRDGDGRPLRGGPSPPVQEAEPAETLKELLLAIPAVGEDQDFERVVDYGREVEI